MNVSRAPGVPCGSVFGRFLGPLGATWGSLEGHLGSLERHLGITLEKEAYMLGLGGAKKRKC